MVEIMEGPFDKTTCRECGGNLIPIYIPVKVCSIDGEQCHHSKSICSDCQEVTSGVECDKCGIIIKEK